MIRNREGDRLRQGRARFQRTEGDGGRLGRHQRVHSGAGIQPAGASPFHIDCVAEIVNGDVLRSRVHQRRPDLGGRVVGMVVLHQSRGSGDQRRGEARAFRRHVAIRAERCAQGIIAFGGQVYTERRRQVLVTGVRIQGNVEATRCHQVGLDRISTRRRPKRRIAGELVGGQRRAEPVKAAVGCQILLPSRLVDGDNRARIRVHVALQRQPVAV